MKFQQVDKLSLILSFIAIGSGSIALLFVCIGIGTPKWESSYTDSGNGAYSLSGTANFFYTCSFTNGTYNNCTSRTGNLTGYPRYSSSYPWTVDYNLRMQNAAGLSVVSILFLFFGLLATLAMVFIPLSLWVYFIPPAILFLASLFMLAGMAEGARYLLFNDYSANLFQTGHLLTIFSVFLTSFAAGRIHRGRLDQPEVKSSDRK